MRLKLIYTLCSLCFISCNLEMLEDMCIPRENVWKDGIVHFKFNDNVPQYHRDLVYEAIEHYESETPLQFKEHLTMDFFALDHGVLIKYSGEKVFNSSYYPYGQGEYITDMRLGGKDYVDLATVIHELGHVVGLPHEHERADRAEYIKINWGHIPKGWEGNFEKTEIDFVAPYDPQSVMGYPPIITDGKPAVEMLDGSEINPSVYLTELDIQKINELYCYELATE